MTQTKLFRRENGEGENLGLRGSKVKNSYLRSRGRREKMKPVKCTVKEK